MATSRLPGVYPKIVIQPNLVAVPGSLRKCLIIGPGKDTYTITEQLVRGTDDVVANTISIIDKVYDSYASYTQGVSYDYTVVSGATISWNSGKGPTSGDNYWITYAYSKSSTDLVPKTFYNLSDVIDEYGYPSTEAEVNIYPIAVAAQMLFENNVSSVICWQPATAMSGMTDSQLYSTYNTVFTGVSGTQGEALMELDCQVILPMYTATSNSDSMIQSLSTHLTNAASDVNRKYRVGVFGHNSTDKTATQAKTTAVSYKTTRLDYAYLKKINKTFEFGEVELDGMFFGAVMAGISCSSNYDSAEPWTNKPAVGLTSAEFFGYGQIIDLRDSGVITLRTYTGADMYIADGTTTDRTTYIGQEASVQTSLDEIVNDLRIQLEQIYLGTKFDDRVLSNMPITAQKILDGKKADQICQDAKVNSAVRDPLNPYRAILTLTVVPMFATKEINLNVLVATTL